MISSGPNPTYAGWDPACAGTASGYWVFTEAAASGRVVLFCSWSSLNSGAIEPEPVIDPAQNLLERKRRISRAARVAATLAARALRRRGTSRPRATERFAGRMCSIASRWMVLQ